MTKRKTFVEDNPALRFITNPEEPQAREDHETPAGYKPNPAYVEVKSKRVQLLMQPSLHSKVKALADREGVSLNEYIHKMLEETVKEDK